MAHKLVNCRAIVDWTTGDPEGDRLVLLAAYRDFIKEINVVLQTSLGEENFTRMKIQYLFDEWHIDTENQIDEVPRIWIERPKTP